MPPVQMRGCVRNVRGPPKQQLPGGSSYLIRVEEHVWASGCVSTKIYPYLPMIELWTRAVKVFLHFALLEAFKTDMV